MKRNKIRQLQARFGVAHTLRDQLIFLVPRVRENAHKERVEAARERKNAAAARDAEKRAAAAVSVPIAAVSEPVFAE